MSHYKIEALLLNPSYPPELDCLNQDLVCYVVDKSTNKVKDVAVVKRRSLGEWYRDRRLRFSDYKHSFVLATSSVVGVVKDAELVEVDEAESPQARRRNYNPDVN